MIKIDFEQSLNDHKSLLILVKSLGCLEEKLFAQVFNEVSRYRTAQVPNTTRTLHIKYAQQILPQFIEWSTFHSHRKVLGLICVAKCSDTKDMEKMTGKINDLKSQFNSTLVDSRCFVVGCSNDDQGSTKKDFIILKEENLSEDIEKNMTDLVGSLFNVLESKRISKCAEKPEKATSVYAPVEVDNFSSGEDSRNSKRKSIGRSRKHLGDISMLTGLHQDALNQYSMAIEHLRTINDFLWLAGALEGQCAASLAMTVIHNNSCKSLILQTECAAKTSTVTSNGFGNDLDEAKFKNTTPLPFEEIYERLSEALFLYARIKGSSVVEVEAHLKLTRLFVSQRKTIEASSALQSALTVSVPGITDQEKVQRYSSAALLYKELGFHRKAAFYTRVAAMQCVSQSLPAQAWGASYSLLLEAIKGYNINLDANKFLTGCPNGWPALQIRLLHELVYTARRLGDPALAVRHITFLLHTMSEHLNDVELSDLAGTLSTLAKQCSGSVSLPPDSHGNRLTHHFFPEVAFTKMPLVRSFKVHPLPSHLKPVGRKTASLASSPSNGPFIFSSLRRNPKEQKKKKNMLWVRGEVGQVSMEIYNTMPFELKVNKMALCIEGINFEPFPANLSLPANTGPHSVMLLGIPHDNGPLKITGYSVNILGTDNICPLIKDNMANKEDLPIVVDVVDFMPLLQVSTSLPKVRSTPTDIDSPQSAPLVTAVTLYAGQSMKGVITLENIGKKAIMSNVINLGSDLGEGAHDIFSFDEEEVNSCLPLHPGKTSNISVIITGIYHIPSTIGSTDNVSYDPEAPWGLNGTITFRYSGEVEKDHLCRRVSMTIDVSVVPSLHCHNYELRPIPRDKSKCLLLFDADNKTSNDMELECTVKSDLGCNSSIETSIQGNDSKRLSLYLPRFLLDPEIDKDTDKLVKYSQAIKDMIKLQWKLPVCKVSGYGNIDNFKVSYSALQILQPSPIIFDISVNNKKIDTDKSISVACCSTVTIYVQITNKSDMAYNNLYLLFEPYQDHSNGYRVNELNGKVAWVGDLSSTTCEVPEGGSMEHSCTFVFFNCGEYFIKLSCYEPSLQNHVTMSVDSMMSNKWNTGNPTLKISVLKENFK